MKDDKSLDFEDSIGNGVFFYAMEGCKLIVKSFSEGNVDEGGMGEELSYVLEPAEVKQLYELLGRMLGEI